MDENRNLEPEEEQPGTPPEAGAEIAEAAESTDSAGAGGEEGEEDAEDGAADKVFGLSRRTFHLVVVGYALGIIVVSLFGLAGLYPEDAGTVFPGIIGAALGYALAAYLDKRDAARDSGKEGR